MRAKQEMLCFIRLHVGKERLMITYQVADIALLTELNTLWEECFADDASYIRFFYAHRFSAAQILAAMDGDKVVGVIHLLPLSIQQCGKRIPAQYAYAGGVREHYRRSGIYAELLRRAFAFCTARGELCVLHPATEALQEYYLKQGMQASFYCKQVRFTDPIQAAPRKLQFTDLDATTYRSIREAALKRLPMYGSWDTSAISYAIAENIYCGGFCKQLHWENAVYLLHGHVLENQLYVTETTLPDKLLALLHSDIAAAFDAVDSTYLLPAQSCLPGELAMMGMQYPASSTHNCNGYLNLCLT